MKFKDLVESPVGQKGRTSVKDAMAHITPELEKKFFKIVKEMGGKTVANILLNKITVAPVGTSDSVLKRYQDTNHLQADRLQKQSASKINEDFINFEDLNEDEVEELLIKNKIKIKSKFGTKFGTEYVLVKKYNEKNIKDILDGYKVTFDDVSIFVSK